MSSFPGLRASRLAARALAAGALLAMLAATPGVGQDVIVKRGGGRLPGAVRACVAERCQLGSTSIPWSEIRWIGLAVGEDAPPASRSTSEDLLFLRDDRVIAGKLVGVSTGIVTLVQGEYERRLVKWILLGTEGAPDIDTMGGSGGGGGGGGGAGGGGGGGGGGGVREPNDPPVKPFPPDKPLGGHLNYDYRVKDREYSVCKGRARLWFRLHPVDRSWPAQLYGMYHADAIDYRLVNQGCTDVPDPHQVCTAPQQPEIRGRVVIGPIGQFGVDMLGAPGGTASFTPIEPELSLLTLPEEIRSGAKTPLTCRDLSTGTSSTGEWVMPVIADVRTFADEECSNPMRLSACVAPTVCTDASEGQRRDCYLRPARYAVIPFEGHEQVTTSVGGTDVTLGYRWEVCCGCGEPPSGPPPELSQDPCGDFAQYVDRLRLAIDQAALRRAQLKTHWDRFQQEKHQAEQYYSDFKLVSNSCLGWDVAMMLAEAMLGGAGTGGVEALAPPEGAAAFAKLYTFIKAALEEDPTVILTSFLGAAEELEVGGEAALEVTLFNTEGFTASGVWDTVSTIHDAGQLYFTAEDAAARRERLEDCTDVPLVSHLVLEGARDHLDHLEAALREVPEMGRLTTLVEQADTEIVQKWHEYYSACLNYAACSGRDPAGCRPPPQ
jgi:hypothetical protein